MDLEKEREEVGELDADSDGVMDDDTLLVIVKELDKLDDDDKDQLVD